MTARNTINVKVVAAHHLASTSSGFNKFQSTKLRGNNMSIIFTAQESFHWISFDYAKLADPLRYAEH